MDNKNKEQKTPLLEIICDIMYNYFLTKILSKSFIEKRLFLKFNEKEQENILKKANLKLLPIEYYSTIIFFTILLFLLSVGLATWYLIKQSVIHFIFIFTLSFIGIIIFLILSLQYPYILAESRKREIDASVQLVLPYFKILSSQLNLKKSIDLMTNFIEYKEIKTEFEKIRYYTNFLGYNINYSIKECTKSCPSENLNNFLLDLSSISLSGNDINKYIDNKIEEDKKLNVEGDKKLIELYLILSQVYIVFLLIGPLFFALMSSILGSIQTISVSNSPGTNADVLLNFIYLIVGLPFLYIGFIFLIYYLKPLKYRL